MLLSAGQSVKEMEGFDDSGVKIAVAVALALAVVLL